MGRFITSDTLILTEFGLVGYNQFTYCINNPVRYHDVRGYMPEEDCISDDPEEYLFPDKDALGAPSNYGNTQGKSSGNGSVGQVSASSSKNPGGRHGGQAHRSSVNMLRGFFTKLGYNVSSTESRVYFGDAGQYRYPDLIVSSDEGIVRYVQVGRQTSKGMPVAREQRAINDLKQTGVDVWFVPYN